MVSGWVVVPPMAEMVEKERGLGLGGVGNTSFSFVCGKKVHIKKNG